MAALDIHLCRPNQSVFNLLGYFLRRDLRGYTSAGNGSKPTNDKLTLTSRRHSSVHVPPRSDNSIHTVQALCVCEGNASRRATFIEARVASYPFLVDGVFPEGKDFLHSGLRTLNQNGNTAELIASCLPVKSCQTSQAQAYERCGPTTRSTIEVPSHSNKSKTSVEANFPFPSIYKQVST